MSSLRPEAAALDRVVARLLAKNPRRALADRHGSARGAELDQGRTGGDVADRRPHACVGSAAPRSPQAAPYSWPEPPSLACWPPPPRSSSGAMHRARTKAPRSASPYRWSRPPRWALAAALGARLALSADGTKLVYVAEDDRGSRLYLRRIDSLQASAITGTQGAMSVSFAPDGEWVGFFAGGKLKKVRIDGALVVTICDALEGVGASWGADDVIVFAPSPSSALFRVSSRRRPQAVTTLASGETSHRWPHILPGAGPWCSPRRADRISPARESRSRSAAPHESRRVRIRSTAAPAISSSPGTVPSSRFLRARSLTFTAIRSPSSASSR